MVRPVLRLVAVVLILILTPSGPARSAALSDADAHTLRNALAAIESGHWKKVRRLAARLHDRLAIKLVRWIEYAAPSGASFEDITRFIEANPLWPNLTVLRLRAEEAIDNDTPDARVLAWFAEHPPVTANGGMRYGEALERAGESDKAAAVLRRTWINAAFGHRQEHDFLHRHRKVLRQEDHIARLDRLLWDGQRYAARRMMRRVPKGWRALAQARLLLRGMEWGVDAAIARVPEELKDDPGLAYERLRWRRRKGRPDSAREILENPPDELVRPEAWWDERVVVARALLARGDVSTAYRLVNAHAQNGGASYAQAEWLAGWIALRFLREGQRALDHFVNLYSAVRYPISRARGAYWAGRAAEALDYEWLSHEWYRRAARHPTAFYGQLAAVRLGGHSGLGLPEPPQPNHDELRAFELRELVQAARILGRIDDLEHLRLVLLRLQELAQTPGEEMLVTELALQEAGPDAAVTVARRASLDGVQLVDYGYPLVAVPEAGGPEPALILAMMRQESGFDTEAVSGAGARGLMQLMPTTARLVARHLRVKYSRHKLLSDPDYNLMLGRAYISRLLDEFDGSYVLALAAYNAGPARVSQWMRAFGDPRKPDVDSIDWIEMIPIYETRDYVQRVIENLQVYRQRLGMSVVALALDRDLHLARTED